MEGIEKNKLKRRNREVEIRPSAKPVFASLVLTVALVLLGVIVSLFFFSLEVIFAFIVSGGFVVFFSLIGVVQQVITVLCTKYTIRENEIEIHYSFLSSSTKVIRLDQITSVSYRIGIIQRMFGVGTVSFNIFGKANAQQANQGGKVQLPNALRNIPDTKIVFAQLGKDIGVDFESETSSLKPKASPMLVLAIVLLITSIFPLMLIPCIISFVYWMRFRKTDYVLNDTSIGYRYTYFMSQGALRTPLTKITNTEIKRNIFTYALFKVSSLKIFTGSSNDPTFHFLEDAQKLKEMLRPAGEGVVLEKRKAGGSVREERPSFSFVIPSIFVSLVFFIVAYVVGRMDNDIARIIAIVVFALSVLILVSRFLLWRSKKYEFYEDRIVHTYGIISIKKQEIYFRNLKYVSLERGWFLDKIFKVGAVHLLTAGSSGVDNSLAAMRAYEKTYEELLKVLK